MRRNCNSSSLRAAPEPVLAGRRPPPTHSEIKAILDAAFTLVKALGITGVRKLSPVDAFVWRYRDGLTVRQIAVRARCSKSLVKLRFRQIERATGLRAAAYSGETEFRFSMAGRIDDDRAASYGAPSHD